MPIAEVNGAKLYYEDTGAGPQTVVFSHSLLFNCRMFDAQVEALKNRYELKVSGKRQRFRLTKQYCDQGRGIDNHYSGTPVGP